VIFYLRHAEFKFRFNRARGGAMVLEQGHWRHVSDEKARNLREAREIADRILPELRAHKPAKPAETPPLAAHQAPTNAMKRGSGARWDDAFPGAAEAPTVAAAPTARKRAAEPGTVVKIGGREVVAPARQKP
jgi:hypothetical protein